MKRFFTLTAGLLMGVALNTAMAADGGPKVGAFEVSVARNAYDNVVKAVDYFQKTSAVATRNENLHLCLLIGQAKTSYDDAFRVITQSRNDLNSESEKVYDLAFDKIVRENLVEATAAFCTLSEDPKNTNPYFSDRARLRSASQKVSESLLKGERHLNGADD